MEKRMRWQGFLTLVAILLTCFTIGMIIVRTRLDEEQEKNDALQISLNRAYESNSELVSQLKLVGTDEYILKSARQDLDYIRPGELRFQVVNPEALYAYSAAELEILMDELSH